MSEQIIYYNRFTKAVRKMDFEEAFKTWVEENGGRTNFLIEINKLGVFEIDCLPITFLTFFKNKFDATLPNEDDENYRDFIYDVDLYKRYISRLKKDYDERPTSPKNIIFIVIIVFAIIGVIKSCN